MFPAIGGLLGNAGGFGGNSSTATAETNSAFTNNAGLIVGGSGRLTAQPDSGIPAGSPGNNVSVYILGAIAAVALLVVLLKK